MVSARNKIHKPAGQEPDELENAVAQALFDLESVAEIKADIMPLQFNAAKEVTLPFPSGDSLADG